MSENVLNIRTVDVTRYIAPLREGGSLPAIAEAGDDFKYVLKFRGAGHGTKALIAEFIGGEIARRLGFRVPELVFADLDEAFGRTEADEEIQELLRNSHGINLGLHFLSGAVTFDPVHNKVDTKTASGIVWLDAFLTNIDRTFRNTNMLMWNRELWLIDHGAALYFHHTWSNWEKHARSRFELIKDHVLLPVASEIEQAAGELSARLDRDFFRSLLNTLPDDWLQWPELGQSPDEIRNTYVEFLTIRLAHSSEFVNAALDARKALI
jgi:hypothetical protein